MKIEKKHNQNRMRMHKNIVKKNNMERTNYLTSLDKYINKKNEESILRKENAFKKYQAYVSIIKNINN
jgi:hypothetical protein